MSDDDANGSQSVTLDGSDSSDADGIIVTYDWYDGATPLAMDATANPIVTLAVGAHTITLTVTDDGGETSSDVVGVTVLANQPPTAEAGENQTVTDAGDDGTETVTLDGSASVDPDGNIAAYEWYEGTGPDPIASGANPTLSLTVGTHEITLMVTDNGGATTSDSVDINVTAPSGEAATMDVLDLSASSTSNKSRWTAEVTITVVDDQGVAVDGASVTGDWDTGASGTCTTGAPGSCTVSLSNIRKKDGSVVFSGIVLSHGDLSDGGGGPRSIVVNKP